MKKFGFTLSEVLITLGIIGVVAAITLPGLINNTRNQNLAAQTSKFYRNITTSLEQFLADSEADTLQLAGFDMSTFITSHFKVEKRCSSATDTGCFAASYKAFDGDSALTRPTVGNVFALNDGTVVGVVNSSNSGGIILVDINGAKNPNRVGYDLWMMNIFNDGTVDDIGLDQATRISNNVTTAVNTLLTTCKGGSAYGCFGHFLRSGFRFDY